MHFGITRERVQIWDKCCVDIRINSTSAVHDHHADSITGCDSELLQKIRDSSLEGARILYSS